MEISLTNIGEKKSLTKKKQFQHQTPKLSLRGSMTDQTDNWFHKTVGRLDISRKFITKAISVLRHTIMAAVYVAFQHRLQLRL